MKTDSFNVFGYSFLGNVGQVPVKWNPIIHGMVGDQTVSVLVDLDTNKVMKIDHIQSESLIVGGGNAYGVDQHVSSSTTRGLKITTPDQPINYVGNSAYSGYSGFSLNAVMSGSVVSNACTPAQFPNSYIMQAGYLFKNNGWYIVFADTLTTNSNGGCAAVPTSLPLPLPTDDIEFTIYASGGIWNGVIQNLRTLDTQYFTRSGLPSSVLKTDTYATGAFMENGYTGSGWDSQFSPKSISATNAKFKNTSNVWTNWTSDSTYVVDCHGAIKTTNNPLGSTSLKNGGTATWNITTMTSWPKC